MDIAANDAPRNHAGEKRSFAKSKSQFTKAICCTHALTWQQKVAALWLLEHANSELFETAGSLVAWPSLETLAADLDVDAEQMRLILKAIVAAGAAKRLPPAKGRKCKRWVFQESFLSLQEASSTRVKVKRERPQAARIWRPPSDPHDALKAFVPSAETIAWASEHCAAVDDPCGSHHVEKFKNHFLGNGQVPRGDLDAAFRKWLGREQEFALRGGGKRVNGNPYIQAALDKVNRRL